MTSRMLILFCLGLFLKSGSVAEEPTLSDLEGLTQQWIGLRSSLAEEKRVWDWRKAGWQQEIELLAEQKQVLGKELETTRDSLSTAEERRADVLLRQEKADAELKQIDMVLEQAILEAQQLAALLPAPLQQQLPSDLQSFVRGKTPEGPRPQQAQRLVAFLSSFESMQNRFHAVQQTLETPAGRRQVDVLYMGLARGFAVSPGEDWAAVGTPGTPEWTWTEGSVDPRQVRQLLDVYQHRETATLVSAPLAVEEGP